MVKDLIGAGHADGLTEVRKQIINRHIAWLTALRYQLREQRAWETSRTKPSNKEYGKRFHIEEWATRFENAVAPYLAEEELAFILARKNRATQLIGLQSAHIKQLKLDGHIEPLDYIEMEKLLVDLFDQQGKCERIKNFPYPRQFATISQMFTRLFVCLVPFGVLNEFYKLGGWMVWLSVPFSAVVGWIFLTMERVGENTENPFEGGANDVPITALSRTIEIDLLEMLSIEKIPEPIQPVNYILS
jgi:putative membrane protein